jgi:hypothetical protein
MSFKNYWTISSSYDFQAHHQHSQRRCCFSLTAPLWFKVNLDLSLMLLGTPRLVVSAPTLVAGTSKVLSGSLRFSQTYLSHSHCTPVPVIRDPSDSEGRQECPPWVWYSSEIDASKFTLHILSDTPGGFLWPKYIVLMSRATICWATEGHEYTSAIDLIMVNWQLTKRSIVAND